MLLYRYYVIPMHQKCGLKKCGALYVHDAVTFILKKEREEMWIITMKFSGKHFWIFCNLITVHMPAINYSAFFMSVCSDILLLPSWIWSSHTFIIGKKLVWKK